jgi:hypothetical protein
MNPRAGAIAIAVLPGCTPAAPRSATAHGTPRPPPGGPGGTRSDAHRLRRLRRDPVPPRRTALLEHRPAGLTCQAPRFPADFSPGEIYPSEVSVPHPGCWDFTLTWTNRTDTVVLPFTAPPR